MARRGEEWAERDAAVNWCIATVAISFAAFFVLSIACFAFSYLIAKGISQETMGVVWKFLKKLAFDPTYLGHTYWNWIKKFYNTGGAFNIPMWLPTVPFFSFFVILVTGLIMNPHEWMSQIHGSGRIATYADIKKMGLFDGFIVVLGRWKGKLLRLPETDEDTEEDVSAALKTLFISDGVKIFGKETFYEEWAEKTRMCVILCTPKEANGFFIQAFYQHRLRNRDCANLRGYYRDMTDADAAEEIKKIQAGTFNTAKYDKITFWERPPLSWKKAKVMFCMLPDFDEMNGK